MVEQGTRDEIERLCRDVLGPLVQADGGDLYLVSATSDEIHIHLSGTCAGCPGASLTRDRMVAPVLLSAAPKAKITVTTGWRVPEGAHRFTEEPGGVPTLPKTEAAKKAS